jgi:putative NADPH-quinone reductase
MSKRILIIQGHPDPQKNHYGNALADAYIKGAQAGGHEVELVSVADLEFPFLRTDKDFNDGEAPESIRKVQDKISAADHLVLFYPLWMGTMPALLKAFIEQTLRPGFAFSYEGINGWPRKLLKGKSARVVITMGMPGFIYRWFYCAHSLKNLKRNILAASGISPVRHTLVGMVEGMSETQRKKWLNKLEDLGKNGG